MVAIKLLLSRKRRKALPVGVEKHADPPALSPRQDPVAHDSNEKALWAELQKVLVIIECFSVHTSIIILDQYNDRCTKRTICIDPNVSKVIHSGRKFNNL